LGSHSIANCASVVSSPENFSGAMVWSADSTTQLAGFASPSEPVPAPAPVPGLVLELDGLAPSRACVWALPVPV
jgi:hypothetical protein